jgi:uncharacterized damage-inducible protein DinB
MNMATESNIELNAVQQDVEHARQELLTTLGGLTDEDLNRSRRGGWTAGRVVHHVLTSEWHYERLIRQLRELPPSPQPALPDALTSVQDAVRELAASRQALIDALAGIDEESFYRLGTLGREEYSVLSVLENVAHHDREHGGQIGSIVAAT